MPVSPVPIYLGWAGLIVGSLGLGAQHLLSGSSGSAINTTAEQPLFARSVEEASLPATGWPTQHVGVAHYNPMVELLTTPARSAQSMQLPAAEPSQTVGQSQSEQHAPREVVRDLSQTRQSRRSRNQRNRHDARANEETVSNEQVDPRAARAEVDGRKADRRESRSRRSERRYRDRDDSADTHMRSDRRRVETEDERPPAGERRVVREEIREPEPRVVRGPEPRDGGFTPFRMFGIFDR
jgi:Spy/CpxP family protein refolding chaperone